MNQLVFFSIEQIVWQNVKCFHITLKICRIALLEFVAKSMYHQTAVFRTDPNVELNIDRQNPKQIHAKNTTTKNIFWHFWLLSTNDRY